MRIRQKVGRKRGKGNKTLICLNAYAHSYEDCSLDKFVSSIDLYTFRPYSHETFLHTILR